MKLNSKVSTHRDTNNQVAELRIKSSMEPVYNICPKTGERTGVSQTIQNKQIGWKAFTLKYRGPNKFMCQMRRQTRKYGLKSLSEKQIEVIKEIKKKFDDCEFKSRSGEPSHSELNRIIREINKLKK